MAAPFYLLFHQGCCRVVSVVVLVVAVSVALVLGVVVGCGVLQLSRAIASTAMSKSFFMVFFLSEGFDNCPLAARIHPVFAGFILLIPYLPLFWVFCPACYLLEYTNPVRKMVSMYHTQGLVFASLLLQGHGFSTLFVQKQNMKDADKKQPSGTQPATGSEPLPPEQISDQPSTAAPSETPAEAGDYVVKGSGLGIDE